MNPPFSIGKISLLKSKKFFSLTILLVILIPVLSYKRVSKQAIVYQMPKEVVITMCGNFAATSEYMLSPVKLLKGLGDLHYPIQTKVVLAQQYFDQGLKLIYAFNHVEALRAFKEAARLDPACAMAYWGQALALGPNINDWNPKDRESMAQDAITKALQLAANTTPKEIDFIQALAKRYDGKAHDVRDTLNLEYAQAMEELVKKYPSDSEALVLYGDAIMNKMPWDYWNRDGSPREGTMQARTAIETALKKFPSHPGAHHLYIHLIEASNKPGDAYASAKFLENAMPKAGHIVHMPAHIYMRVGEYGRSNTSNIVAIKVDEEFLAESEDQGSYRVGYYPHNIDFLVFGSLMNGQYQQAFRDGSKLAYHMKALESMMPTYFDFFNTIPIITYVRFGAWNEILALPPSDTRYFQSMTTQYFARGLAFLRKEMLQEAQAELAKLDSVNNLDTLKSIYAFYNSTFQISNVATQILKGELLAKQGKKQEGIKALQMAVAAEDTMRYNEPPDWRLPARQYLGAVLLESGQYDEAEKVFETDLLKNPENGWALQGLLQSQKKLGKTKEAAKTQQRFDQAWKNADVKITTSRF